MNFISTTSTTTTPSASKEQTGEAPEPYLRIPGEVLLSKTAPNLPSSLEEAYQQIEKQILKLGDRVECLIEFDFPEYYYDSEDVDFQECRRELFGLTAMPPLTKTPVMSLTSLPRSLSSPTISPRLSPELYNRQISDCSIIAIDNDIYRNNNSMSLADLVRLCPCHLERATTSDVLEHPMRHDPEGFDLSVLSNPVMEEEREETLSDLEF